MGHRYIAIHNDHVYEEEEIRKNGRIERPDFHKVSRKHRASSRYQADNCCRPHSGWMAALLWNMCERSWWIRPTRIRCLEAELEVQTIVLFVWHCIADLTRWTVNFHGIIRGQTKDD